MADSKRGPAGLAVLAGGVAIVLAVWWLAGGSPEPTVPSDVADPPTTSTQETAPDVPDPAAGASAEPGGLRIASGGRLSLERDTLPEDRPLGLTLALPDEARGSGDHTVRVVSTDGRRLDVTASALPGDGSGVQLEIDPAFLSRGRYMIEVETEEKRPLPIRRYVLEVR